MDTQVNTPELFVDEQAQQWQQLQDAIQTLETEQQQNCLANANQIRQVMLASPWCLQNWMVTPEEAPLFQCVPSPANPSNIYVFDEPSSL